MLIFRFLLRHLAAYALLGAACVSATGLAAELSVNRLTVALQPDKDPDRMLEERASLEKYLETGLGVPVRVVIPMSSAVIIEGFANGSIDVAYLSSTDALRAMEDGAGSIVLAGEIDGKTHYNSYWVTLKDKPYESVEDLRGKRIAFSSRTSTSGYMIPVWDLYKKDLITAEEGPDGFFGSGNVTYGVGYVSAVEHVLRGSAEAAAVSDYVLDKDRHLRPEQREQLRMLAKQGPVPTHTISVRSNLAPEDRQALERGLLEMNEKKPELRDKVFTSRLVVVDPEEHVRVTREAFDLIKRMRF